MTSFACPSICVFCGAEIPLEQWPPMERRLHGVVEFWDTLPRFADVDSLFRTASFHWQCFLTWDGHAEFAARQLELSIEHETTDSDFGLVYADGDIVMLCGVPWPDHIPETRTIFLKFTLADTGSCVTIPFSTWTTIVHDLTLLDELAFLYPEERTAIVDVASRLPTAQSASEFLTVIDLDAKHRLHEQKTFGETSP